MATTKGEAFAKGGFGCIAAFIAFGIFCVMVGGSVRIDLGGALMLFVIGGIIGLVALMVYSKGEQAGRHQGSHRSRPRNTGSSQHNPFGPTDEFGDDAYPDQFDEPNRNAGPFDEWDDDQS
jgi:hypothetical protein